MEYAVQFGDAQLVEITTARAKTKSLVDLIVEEISTRNEPEKGSLEVLGHTGIDLKLTLNHQRIVVSVHTIAGTLKLFLRQLIANLCSRYPTNSQHGRCTAHRKI